MSEKIPPLQPADVKRQLSHAGFSHEEITDMFDKVFSHSKTLPGNDAFYNFSDSIKYLMSDNAGMSKDRVLARLSSEPSPLFTLHGIPFPANTNPRKITLNATPRRNQPEEAKKKAEAEPKNEAPSETQTKAEKPAIVLDFDAIDQTLIAIVETSPNRIRPTAGQGGKIQHGPLKGKLTLAALNMQLREYGIQNPGCGFSSLSTYLEMKNIGVQGSRSLSRRQENMGTVRISAADILLEIEKAAIGKISYSLTDIFSAKRIETLDQAFAKGRVTGLTEIAVIRDLPVTRPEDYIRSIQQFFNTVTNNPATPAEMSRRQPAAYPGKTWG